MTFTQSIKSVFSKYATFTGRASRSEYWYFTLFNIITSTLLFLLGIAIGAATGGSDGVPGGLIVGYILYIIYGLGVLIPSLAVAVRRLHDTNNSGWLILLGLIPCVGGIVLLVFMILQGTNGENKYGDIPE
ncbi:MAG: DUF805 domain-containing protein [Prevotella sp.]|nr:DUF805 domain-containing protein [Prevotella sp.]MDY3246882.1 DUF805 domain-containing protein [Prevotella sp.]